MKYIQILMKFLITYILLLLVPMIAVLSSIWYLISLNQENADLNLKLAAMQKLGQSLIYLSVKRPSIPYTQYQFQSSLNNVQLVEIIPINYQSQQQPKQLILVISIGSNPTKPSNIELLQQLRRRKGENQAQFGLYVIRQLKRLSKSNANNVRQFLQQIHKILKYFSTSLLKEKNTLTVIAYQESGLLLLKTLALDKNIKYQIFNKLILVNLLNPSNALIQDTLVDNLRDICGLFKKYPQRLTNLSQTQIIHIDTLNYAGSRFDYLDLDEMDCFIDSIKVLKLRSSVYISSRIIRDVYEIHGAAFPYQNFYRVLADFLIRDLQKKIPISEIANYFHDQEHLEHPKVRTKTAICYQLDDDDYAKIKSSKYSTDQNCIMIANIVSHKPFLIESQSIIKVYNANYERILPFDNRTMVTYYMFQRINFTHKFYIINPNRMKVRISIIEKYSPKHNPLPFNPSVPCLIKICPGYYLLYPLHFLHASGIQTFFLAQSVPKNQQCYKDVNNYDLYLYQIKMNSDMIINLVLFSLFCSQLTRSGIWDRIYNQMLMNVILWKLFGGSTWCILIGCTIVMVTVALLQYCMNTFVFLCTLMNMFIGIQKKLLEKVVWLPVITQCVGYAVSMDHPPIGIVLLIIIPFVVNRESIIIVGLKLYTNCIMLVDTQGNISQLLLLTVWLSIHLKGIQPNTQKKPKNSKTSLEEAQKMQILQRLKLYQYQLMIRKQKKISQKLLDGFSLFLMSYFINTTQLKIDWIISSFIFGCVIIYILEWNK